MTTRTYQHGRSIDGYTYGDQIESVPELHGGDLLIYDSHQFCGTNLVRVIRLVSDLGGPPNRFHAVYVRPNGERDGPEEFCVWHWELTKERYGRFSYYRAVPESAP